MLSCKVEGKHVSASAVVLFQLDKEENKADHLLPSKVEIVMKVLFVPERNRIEMNLSKYSRDFTQKSSNGVSRAGKWAGRQAGRQSRKGRGVVT
jgi:hypothetical protein